MGVASAYGYNNLGRVSYGAATGGTSSSVTVGGINYTLLTFTTSGTLTVTRAGLFDFLIVGGGGGGQQGVFGGGYEMGGGGGGGGSILSLTLYITANIGVTVGAGGASATVGSNSYIGNSISDYVAVESTGNARGNSEGTGGTSHNGANSGIPLFAFTGGAGFQVGANQDNGGGGAGGGANGGAATSSVAGNGGAGYDRSVFIGGSTSRIAGGGGGSIRYPLTSGSGTGADGGGNGGNYLTAGGNGTVNTGGGGGGGGNTRGAVAAGTGGSGIVYVRFKV